ncbi:unnamed protein product [marine sediment metagenome]|uniref:Uncharacterized protein n=1 Tax=marine sediment metagenome TaxID=412755 RepID=X1TVE6_9ZZZZ
MAKNNLLTKLSRAPVLLSLPALALWIAVAAFLFKWIRAWSAGHLEPGIETSWATLYGFFAVAVLALAAGLFFTIRAWQGKSTVRWQVLSLLLGVLALWMTCGH